VYVILLRLYTYLGEEGVVHPNVFPEKAISPTRPECAAFSTGLYTEMPWNERLKFSAKMSCVVRPAVDIMGSLRKSVGGDTCLSKELGKRR
jgi:hypothetical protein